MYNIFFDSMFDDMFISRKEDRSAKVVSNDDVSDITIDLPGYKKDGLKVYIEEQHLYVTASGERGDKKYKFSLISLVDIPSIDSKFEDGVLNIKVPKKKESTKTIEIK